MLLFPLGNGRDQLLTKILPFEFSLLGQGQGEAKGTTFPLMGEQNLAVLTRRSILGTEHRRRRVMFELIPTALNIALCEPTL